MATCRLALARSVELDLRHFKTLVDSHPGTSFWCALALQHSLLWLDLECRPLSGNPLRASLARPGPKALAKMSRGVFTHESGLHPTL